MTWLSKFPLAPIITAVLFALASPLYNQGYLGPIIFVPWLISLSIHQSVKRALLEGVIIQIFFSLGIFWWVPQSFTNLWQNSLTTNWGLFLCLLSFLQLQFASWGIIRTLIFKKKLPWWSGVILSATTYVLLDSIVLKFFKDSIGHTGHILDAWKMAAFYVGVPGLAFILMVLNELVFVAIALKKWKPLVSGLAVVVLALLGINSQKNTVKSPLGLKVAIVQTNQSYQEVNQLKTQDNFKVVLARKILNQIKQAQSLNPDLIVFSESVYPINFDSPKNYKEKMVNDELRSLINQGQIPVILGGHFNLGSDKGITNGMIYFKPGTQLTEQKFYKNKLFPFGEHVPGRQYIPFNLPTVDLNTSGEIIKGEIKGKTFAVLICYETIVPSYVKDVVTKLNPDFIINPTNETYFDTYGEPQLALALTSFRAAEMRLPILRVGNTGITATINSLGQITKKWPMNQEMIKLVDF